MAMFECPGCKHIVDDSIRKCPNCSYDIKKYVKNMMKEAKKSGKNLEEGGLKLSSVYSSSSEGDLPTLDFLANKPAPPKAQPAPATPVAPTPAPVAATPVAPTPAPIAATPVAPTPAPVASTPVAPVAPAPATSFAPVTPAPVSEAKVPATDNIVNDTEKKAETSEATKAPTPAIPIPVVNRSLKHVFTPVRKASENSISDAPATPAPATPAPATPVAQAPVATPTVASTPVAPTPDASPEEPTKTMGHVQFAEHTGAIKPNVTITPPVASAPERQPIVSNGRQPEAVPQATVNQPTVLPLSTEAKPVQTATINQSPARTVVLPTAPTPVQPVAQTPIQPVAPAPVQPIAPAPIQPVAQAPIQPVAPAPVQPVAQAPMQPAAPAPVQPIAAAPNPMGGMPQYGTHPTPPIQPMNNGMGPNYSQPTAPTPQFTPSPQFNPQSGGQFNGTPGSFGNVGAGASFGQKSYSPTIVGGFGAQMQAALNPQDEIEEDDGTEKLFDSPFLNKQAKAIAEGSYVPQSKASDATMADVEKRTMMAAMGGKNNPNAVIAQAYGQKATYKFVPPQAMQGNQMAAPTYQQQGAPQFQQMGGQPMGQPMGGQPMGQPMFGMPGQNMAQPNYSASGVTVTGTPGTGVPMS